MRLERLPTIPEDLKNFYERLAIRAGMDYGALQPLMYRSAAQRARWTRILELLAAQPIRTTCLEYGCCEGLMTRELARLYRGVDAVEISSTSLARCPTLPNVQYFHADATTFLPPRTDYDAILLLEVLEHVVDPPALLQRASRYGRVYASSPISEPLNTIGAFDETLLGHETRQADATGHLWYMDMPGFLSWFQGLRVLHSEVIGYSGFVIAEGAL